MGISFEITYEENPHGMYITGESVKGKATIINDQSIQFKGIQLQVRGYAKVRWTERQGKYSTTYADRENYFESITECIDTKGTEQTLEPGTYTYNFECLLPSECASSFQGMFGRIRYDTKIIIIRPLRLNTTYCMGFNVLKIYDLNHFPALRIPAQLEEFKNFCCGPCKSKPLVISMNINRTSFVPGDHIHVNAHIFNNSSTRIERVRIALNQIALYSVRHSTKTKTHKTAIAKRKFGAFSKNVLDFEAILQVPPTPPTCEYLSMLIQVSYEVEVCAIVKGPHVDPATSIPVVIGNIPFDQKLSNISTDTLIAILKNGAAPGSSSQSYTEIPPPSYEEAFLEEPKKGTFTKSDKEDKSFGKFTPRYPFYGVMEPIPNEDEQGDHPETSRY